MEIHEGDKRLLEMATIDNMAKHSSDCSAPCARRASKSQIQNRSRGPGKTSVHTQDKPQIYSQVFLESVSLHQMAQKFGASYWGVDTASMDPWK